MINMISRKSRGIFMKNIVVQAGSKFIRQVKLGIFYLSTWLFYLPVYLSFVAQQVNCLPCLVILSIIPVCLKNTGDHNGYDEEN